MIELRAKFGLAENGQNNVSGKSIPASISSSRKGSINQNSQVQVVGEGKSPRTRAQSHAQKRKQGFNTKSHVLTAEQLPLLDALAKISLLTITSLLCTIIVLFIYNWAWLETFNIYLQYWIDTCIIVWDSGFNTLCIFLSFAHNNWMYEKLCSFCHVCCVHHCDMLAESLTTRKLRKESPDKYELYMKYAKYSKQQTMRAITETG